MDDFPPLPPPGLVAPDVPVNAPMVLDEMPEVASPPLNIVPLASSDENVPLMAPNAVDDVQDHSSFDLYAQMPAAMLLGEFVEAASSSDSVAQVTQAARGISPMNARGAPVLDSARIVREDGSSSARAVSAPLSARGVREAEPVVDFQARAQAIKHQRTMIDVEGEIDASADTEVMDTDSEHVDATRPVGDALPQDSPVVLMECPIDPPSVPLVRPSASAPERAPSAPLVSSTAAVLESAPVAPLECSIDAPSEPLVQPSASALVNAPSGAPSAP
ncbi:hypothetical protein DCAR_0414444 [Daucus carota subsp. sativus]|uniref:Uncharacterized protein n=1 Tax=Daucus carota subsp. sativus TaxID=79200 RepID=A0A175YBE7_DAUCS|nr:hypothetical protein DCAR_0414444 [Daucus carota subsp. sativus]